MLPLAPPSAVSPYTTLFRSSASEVSKFEYTRNDGSDVSYEAKQGFDLRITSSDLARFAEAIGFSAPRKQAALDRKSTRLNSSHLVISYAVFCLKKKTKTDLS